MPEEEQEIGRAGVKRVQRLLEGTLRFRLPYDAYKHKERVSLKMLGGMVKLYDLNGDFLDEQGQAVTRIFVESKNLADAGGQSAEFEEFLARAYSATMQEREDTGIDPKWEFMWATTCPWKGSGFRQVAEKAALEAAIEAHRGGPVIPEDHVIDRDVLDHVQERLWVWVISDRQEDMTLSAEMRGWVLKQLEEGGE